MASVNKAILVGHLGRDPEVRSTNNGTKVCNLSVATSESWKDKNSGERKSKTEWHRVCVFNQAAVGFAESYLGKGALVYIEGQIQTRKWTDQSGQDRFSTEIVVPAFGGVLSGLDKREATASAAPDAARQGPLSDDLDDDLPF